MPFGPKITIRVMYNITTALRQLMIR